MSAEAAPPETPAAPPPAPAPTQPPPDAAEVADNAPEPEAPPVEKPNLAAEVMKQRDARQLAAIVREKKQLEATAAKYKEHEPKMAAFERIEKLMDEGDRAGAFMELHRLKYGDSAADEFAASYNGLTEHILGAQTKLSPEIAQVKREVSRTANEVAALKLERDQYQAKLAEKEEAERNRAVEGAKLTVGGFLKDTEHEYPYLMAEADAPEDIVWGILEAAAERNEDITLAQAAELANEHFKPAFEKKAPRYQNLLAPKQANGVPTKPEASKSASTPPRKSITNADASQATNDQALPPPKNETERLERSFAVLQRGLSKQQ